MLDRIRMNRFLVVGRAGLDLYADPPGTRTEEASAFSAALGGSAANIAVAIVKLGGAASLATSVSDDAVGRHVVRQLNSYGVDSSLVRSVRGEARTSLAVVETRAVNCQSVIYRNGAADFQFTDDHVAGLDIKTYGALIVTGTALAMEPSRDATLRLMGRARAELLPVVIDIDYRPYSWVSAAEAKEVCRMAAGMSDIVIGNDEEFAVMADDDGAGFARSLAETTASAVVYKMGERGSWTYSAGSAFETPIFPVTALKPTGAGDAFMGGFITSLAEGLDLETSVRRGSGAAAIVVMRVGCAPAMPNSNELAEFLATRSN
jgi:5-dehydro-2-deoxygluconokinase